MKTNNKISARNTGLHLAVIGGGPGGLHAAIAAARQGMKVTLFEKRELGEHIICGECIFDSLDLLPPPGAGLLYEVEAVLLSARGSYRLPIGRYRRLYMMDRRVWQRQLAATAADLGVSVLAGAKINIAGLRELRDRFDWIIDASGAPSITSRAYGFTGEYLRNPLLAYQYFVEGDFSALFLSRTIKVVFPPHVERDYLPGYYWLFPKNEHQANFGVVFTHGRAGKFPLRLKELLHEIAGRESLSLESVGHRGGGLIPTRILDRLVHERIVLVGDAAGLPSPLHGGGIDLACISGTLAAAAISKGATGVAAYRRDLLRLLQHKLAVEKILIAKMKTLSWAAFDDLIHAAAVRSAGIRTRVGLRHPGLLAAAWRWLQKRPAGDCLRACGPLLRE
ncbi:MAG TPA: NAD(P)/FAD-dependent oxidoreductase [Syntrophales bacterium]|nr:NAD(P)/FAD-dependent oxidoreductase [Syntrophales bacterium]HQI35879.1 NAD(P)/FAD-dependent oxidoreductase [Syntrophales bacterium]HRR47299.1 NAD(P)/FAD-dependent oxidoreductase [Syntrophales bacterium]